jgi:tetratricopeptide (TPR) repeat protein
MALQREGRWSDAEQLFEQALRQSPQDFRPWYLLGALAVQTARNERALTLLTQAVKLEAHADAVASAGAHFYLGFALKNLKRFEEAAAGFERAVLRRGDFAEAHTSLSAAYIDLNRHAQALDSADCALALRPESVNAHINRGAALLGLDRPAEALASLDRALMLRPDAVAAHSLRGAALLEFQRTAEALASCERAIALAPDHPDAHVNLGRAWQFINRPDAALPCHERAMSLDPTLAVAHWNASLCCLQMGDMARGWPLFEWRKRLKRPFGVRDSPQPPWSGAEDLTGKALLVHSEQGLGDTLQFCRYVTLVAALGARVILEVDPPLQRLLASLEGVHQVFARGDELPHFDFHCPMLSLPLACRTTLATVPARIPYLRSSPEAQHRWRRLLGEKNRLRVGLVWSGGFRPAQPDVWSVNRRRNIPLARFASLRHPDIEFHSVQKGQPAEAELAAAIAQRWQGPHVIDHSASLHDFSDTAALLGELDLLISVDTATAHLAGALGKPVWILNRFDSCWRWLLDRTDSPWYPTARLYRQTTPGDWDGVMQRVGSDLAQWVAEWGTTSPPSV